VTISREDIIEAICKELEPLKPNVSGAGIADEIGKVLDKIRDFDSMLAPLTDSTTNAKTQSSNARILLEQLRKGKAAVAADRLRATIPEVKALEDRLELLLGITGPSIKFGRTQDLAATVAHSWTKRFSERKATSTEGGPMRNIASWIYDYLTDKPDHELERACKRVLAREAKVERDHARLELVRAEVDRATARSKDRTL
jgi:hypothetical protein